MKNGVVMYDTVNNVLEQLYFDLDFGEALDKVIKLRQKRDGKWYWIGRKESHLGLLK